MTDFLAENACGQNILQIVSVGNSIIAELMRLKDYIPSIYKDQQKYGEILLDFSYLKIAEAHEKKIEDNEDWLRIDDEIRENYLDLITRFYLAFESTHQYATDLNNFVADLNRGYYIQQTLESVLQDPEGKQLMCESLYIFGVILLILDYHIPGPIRERLLVSYYRYSAAKSGDSNIDDVCMLLRSTGYIAASSARNANNAKNTSVTNYPESYFARYKFDEIFVEMVIGRLRCDDIYNQLSIYPHPEHRSTALSGQAAMLFVCLYFTPRVLHSQVAQMREIVDKFFSDNWIVSIYMGVTVNLLDAWDQFKAAKAALAPVVEPMTVKGFCLLHREKLVKTLDQTREMLRDGVCTDYYVLQNISKIIVLLRQCNVLLRWYFIHARQPLLEISHGVQTKMPQLALHDESQFKDSELFELLLNCSQLELIVRDIVRTLMQERTNRWENFRTEALVNVKELIEAFGGSRPLAKIESNPQLKAWFTDIAKEIEKLSVENPKSSGRTIIQVIQALEEVQEFHNLRANMQVKQCLLETRDLLQKLIQIINVKEDLLINMQLIGDFSYAWHLLDRDFTSIMQESIKKQPKSVIRLRAVFLKLASALEIPLLRINQAKSVDLVSVSNYYSSELVNYFRKVLQIIPETMFSILARIIALQTEILLEIPTRLEKDKLKEYAQFEDRYAVAKLTHSIATFTEGILMMKKTLVGVIELDPKQLLEDGIRKELMLNLANALNLGLIFPSPQKNRTRTQELDVKLVALAKVMDGYRRSFEYIQDYLNIHGLKILQEELTRLINCNVERECNMFLHLKVHDWQSQYQSVKIPIPSFAPVQGDTSNSNNFIGRLAYELLQCTDAKQTIYLQLKAAWYIRRGTHTEALNGQLFVRLRDAIGPAGLVGLDHLYAYMLKADLHRYLDKMLKNISSDSMWLEALNSMAAELKSPQFPTPLTSASGPLKYYGQQHARWLKVWPTILDWMMELGHKQIIRQHIAFELKRSSKCNSKNLQTALETFNRALLTELEHSGPEAKLNNPEQETTLLADVNAYLQYTGQYEPLEQMFHDNTKNNPHVALFLFLFTIAHLSRLQYNASVNSLLSKSSKDPLDVIYMLMGLITVLQQFHRSIKRAYLTHLCQYATVLAEANLSIKNELGPDATIALHFLQAFVTMTPSNLHILRELLPDIILNQFDYLAINSK